MFCNCELTTAKLQTHLFALQLYDKKEDDTRKCLLPKLWNAPAQNNETNESNMFDIYLCDNCEAELYSKEAYLVSNYLIDY